MLGQILDSANYRPEFNHPYSTRNLRSPKHLDFQKTTFAYNIQLMNTNSIQSNRAKSSENFRKTLHNKFLINENSLTKQNFHQKQNHLFYSWINNNCSNSSKNSQREVTNTEHQTQQSNQNQQHDHIQSRVGSRNQLYLEFIRKQQAYTAKPNPRRKILQQTQQQNDSEDDTTSHKLVKIKDFDQPLHSARIQVPVNIFGQRPQSQQSVIKQRTQNSPKHTMKEEQELFYQLQKLKTIQAFPTELEEDAQTDLKANDNEIPNKVQIDDSVPLMVPFRSPRIPSIQTRQILKEYMQKQQQLLTDRPITYTQNYSSSLFTNRLKEKYIDVMSDIHTKRVQRQDKKNYYSVQRDKQQFKQQLQLALQSYNDHPIDKRNMSDEKQKEGKRKENVVDKGYDFLSWVRDQKEKNGLMQKVKEQYKMQKQQEQQFIKHIQSKNTKEEENKKVEEEVSPFVQLVAALRELKQRQLDQQQQQESRSSQQNLNNQDQKQKGLGLLNKLTVKFSDAIEKRLEELNQQYQLQQLQETSLDTSLIKSKITNQYAVRVEQKYRIRDNIELDYYLAQDDPRKRFFIQEMVDFDGNILVGKLTGSIGSEFQFNFAQENVKRSFNPIAQCWWEKIDCKGDIPSNRENAYFTCKKTGKILMFGGHNGADLTDIYSFSLKTQNWQRIIPKVDSNGEIKAPQSLYGYGSAMWQRMNKLVVFGGAKDIESVGQRRNKICLRDVKTFDFKTRLWEEFQINGEEIKGKQSFASCIIEESNINGFEKKDYFMIQGGFQNQKVFSNECFALDLNNHTWNQIQFNGKEQPPFLANHSITIYKPQSNKQSQDVILFIFGGIDGDMHSASNKLYKMQRIGGNGFDFKITEVANFKGQPPIPRSHHSSVLLSQRYLLIYGGRNDQYYKKCQQIDIYTNDIVLFDIQTNEWISFEQFGYVPLGRWGASLIVYEGGSQQSNDRPQIILFGGTNLKGYVQNNTYKMLIGKEQVKEKIEETQEKLTEFYRQLREGVSPNKMKPTDKHKH